MLSAATARGGMAVCKFRIWWAAWGGNRQLPGVPQRARLFGGQPEAGVYAPASGRVMRFSELS